RTGLIAVKRGMTTLFDVHGAAVATTILEVRACQVVRSRWDPQTAQYLVEVGASDGLPVGPNRLSPAQRGHFDRHQCEPKPCLTSFPVDDAAVLPSGTPLTSTHFVPGQYIDVQGTTLGKGFQGAMKRWGFHGQDASHGVSKAHRSLGS
ncbi:translation protein, partial [Caulochytrium protostelioides]